MSRAQGKQIIKEQTNVFQDFSIIKTGNVARILLKKDIPFKASRFVTPGDYF